VSTPLSARLADRRGLTGAGAVVLAIGLTLFGAVIDAGTGPTSQASLRTLFTFCFVVGCLLAVLLVRRDQVGPVLVAIPLAYGAGCLFSGAIHASRAQDSVLKSGLIDGVTSLATRAPSLLIVLLIALLLATVRIRSGRGSLRRPSQPGLPRP